MSERYISAQDFIKEYSSFVNEYEKVISDFSTEKVSGIRDKAESLCEILESKYIEGNNSIINRRHRMYTYNLVKMIAPPTNSITTNEFGAHSDATPSTTLHKRYNQEGLRRLTKNLEARKRSTTNNKIETISELFNKIFNLD